MSTPGSPYYEQMRLLVQLLPFVGRESCFALKGGTAINLFYRNLPRYSVDIDLTYLPLEPWADAQRSIDAALRRIAATLSTGSPSYPVTLGRGKTGGRMPIRGAFSFRCRTRNPSGRCSASTARKICRR